MTTIKEKQRPTETLQTVLKDIKEERKNNIYSHMKASYMSIVITLEALMVCLSSNNFWTWTSRSPKWNELAKYPEVEITFFVPKWQETSDLAVNYCV